MATAIKADSALTARLLGRSFVHPAFDYLVIGGGLSLIVTAIVATAPGGADLISLDTLPYFILLSNSAHFAASTVRLYTKPGSYESLPFLTMAFPLMAIVLLTVCIAYAGELGTPLQALYLAWSPYHYSAQAYGLAVMYSYRSGCMLNSRNKNGLWYVAMLPFVFALLSPSGVALNMVAPTWIMHHSVVHAVLTILNTALPWLAVLALTALIWNIWRSSSGPIPIISVMMLVSNGAWFFILGPLQAFAYATIFHGLQYLAIVIIFHVMEQKARASDHHSTLYHVLWFYAICLLIGYGLFNCMPLAYVWAGFGTVESVLLVAAMINIHHFIVDGYIWRLKKSDTNRGIVESTPSTPASITVPG